jgi:hypothetical protein
MNTLRQKGIALTELVLFIVIIGIVTVGTLKGIYQSLVSTSQPEQIVKAANLANARMQVILLQRAINGVSGLSDPCSTNTLAACATINAYATANSFTVTPSFSVAGNTTTVTVTVTSTGLGSTMTTVVTNYEN